jgi:Asp-tRNA(Asn)/Glu-tRNA(Gln) amidotransferase B subunit
MAKSSTSFTKGRSGNTRGKPVGKTSRARFRFLAEKSLPEIVKKLVEAAKNGDMQAAKIIIDRCVPALRPTSDNIKIATTGTLAERGERLITAMNKGECSPDQAKSALDVLMAQSKLVEQSEITERLETIEKWLQEHNAAR